MKRGGSSIPDGTNFVPGVFDGKPVMVVVPPRSVLKPLRPETEESESVLALAGRAKDAALRCHYALKKQCADTDEPSEVEDPEVWFRSFIILSAPRSERVRRACSIFLAGWAAFCRREDRDEVLKRLPYEVLGALGETARTLAEKQEPLGFGHLSKIPHRACRGVLTALYRPAG